MNPLGSDTVRLQRPDERAVVRDHTQIFLSDQQQVRVFDLRQKDINELQSLAVNLISMSNWRGLEHFLEFRVVQRLLPGEVLVARSFVQSPQIH